MSLLDPDFVYIGLDAADSAAVFERIGGDLRTAGLVADDYVDALNAREKEFPTGLPLPGGVAIPHTDVSHVHSDKVAVAALKHPVEFHEMGGEDDSLISVSTVFLLALSNPSDHLTILQRIIKSIQDEEFLESIRNAVDEREIVALASAAFTDEPAKN
jgi:PTS system galactitol-specific IIA component